MRSTQEAIAAKDALGGEDPIPESRTGSHPIAAPSWTQLVGDHEWSVYQPALQAMAQGGIPFLLGGAFGLAAYTGRWRNTKDLDFFVMPAQHEAFVDALLKAGFVDYYETLPYDRGWIFRAVHTGVIVDIIWDTPNRRSQVDEAWIAHAPHIELRGESLLAVPSEELLVI